MKFKSLLFTVAIAMAMSCGSKETKDGDAKTDSTAVETAAAPETPKTAKEMLAKEWMLDNVDYEATMASLPEADKAGFKSLMDEMIPLMKGKNTYKFNEDSTAEINTMGPDKKMKAGKGTWELSADEKMVTVTNEGQKAELPVVELTADKLSLQQQKLVMHYVPKK
jgi:hypothetical protein